MTKNEKQMLFNIAKSITNTNMSIKRLIDSMPDNLEKSEALDFISESNVNLGKLLDSMLEEWSDK